MPSGSGERPTRTSAQRAGDAAEACVAAALTAQGWQVLGRNVRAGRCELDLVAVDPGPPARLVAVEVRWRRRRDFGLPEETFDRRKRSHVREGLARLVSAGRLPGGAALPRLTPAIDLVVVEPSTVAPDRRLRHYRDALEPV